MRQIIINNVVTADESPFLAMKARQQRDYLEVIHDRYARLPIVELPLFPYELKGRERLKELGKILFP